MPVYVDNAKLPFGRMKMCHMIADTETELHAMADKIGVARRWYQGNASTPHYDICLSKRRLAVELGAIEINRNETAELVKRLRVGRQRDML